MFVSKECDSTLNKIYSRLTTNGLALARTALSKIIVTAILKYLNFKILKLFRKLLQENIFVNVFFAGRMLTIFT